MLEARELSFLEGRIVNFLSKLMPVIGGMKDSATTSNFNNYMVYIRLFSVKWVFAVSFKN
jgi:hypothetical protein